MEVIFPAMISLIFLFYLMFFAVGVALFALWIWMIIDVATREREGNDKIVWLLVVLLADGIGALIYFFARKLPRDRSATSPAPMPPPVR